ncbi:hypothetical protein DRH27_01595 [Candidatus Falkowbacteria bacterium]|nr:MAG: hypothetical protein DRH27_01595 [Candidatus Falkowbacteria bacterium]
MLINRRIIFDDNGTEIDFSVDLNNFRGSSVTLDYVTADDKLYVASDMPLNHLWVEVTTANDQASIASVDIWFNKDWVSAVDLLDHTSAAGVTLAQSGVIQWKTDRNEGWDMEQDSEDVTGVDAVGIYNRYWLRINFSADLAAGTELKYLGHKFASDDAMYTEYPDLNNANLKLAFASGKTDWNDQHFIAAEDLIDDLRKTDIIKSPSQILDFERFEDPAIHKAAEIIYRGMGRAYIENRKDANSRYNDSFNMTFFNVDIDRDGNLSYRERRQRSGFVGR